MRSPRFHKVPEANLIGLLGMVFVWLIVWALGWFGIKAFEYTAFYWVLGYFALMSILGIGSLFWWIQLAAWEWIKKDWNGG